jgi:quinolinate synthase
MINYTSSSPKDSFIIATECGIIHPIHKAAPGKKLIMASEEMICPNMKSITLNKILYSLENMQTIIRVPEEIRLPAAQALEKMIAYSS